MLDNNLPAKYHNAVINGNVMDTLKLLPDNCIDMVYADPDYNVGINYDGKTYTKTWEEYINWYGELICQSMRVLKASGNLFTINYPRQNAHLRIKFLEAIAANVHDYVWAYNTNVGHSTRKFTTAHRSILHAVKSKQNAFYKEQVALPYKNPEDVRIKQRIANGSPGRMPYSWFYFDLVKNISRDKTFHACQIPLGLVELLINASTQHEDTVFILFGGSGSEVALAKKLGRVFLSCEIHKPYVQMIKERLANNGAIPGKYKRMNHIRHIPDNGNLNGAQGTRRLLEKGSPINSRTVE